MKALVKHSQFLSYLAHPFSRPNTKLQAKSRSILFLISFFILAFLQSFHTLTFAAESAQTNAALPPLKIAFLESKPQFHPSYTPREHLEARFNILSKYFDNNYSFIEAPPQPAVGAKYLRTGEADIFFAFIKSPERMYQLKFSKNPIFNISLFIATDKNKKIPFGDTQAIAGKSIAIYAKNSMAKGQLDDFLRRNNIVMSYKLYTSYEKYTTSDADFHLMASYYFSKGKQAVMRIGQQNLYFAALPENAHLLDILDNALELAAENDSNALRQLHEKYVSKDIVAILSDLSPAEQEIAKQSQSVYRLAYSSDHKPIQYTNEQGVPSGIAIGVLNLFKKMHDTDTEAIPYSTGEKLNLSQFDMLFSVVGDKKLKDELFYTSKTYLNLPMVLFKHAETKEILSYGMLDYSVLDHASVKNTFPLWELKIYNTLDELFAAYKNQEIDSILLSQVESNHALTVLGTNKSKIVPVPLNLPLKFYLSKKYPSEALNVLNSYINKLNPLDLETEIFNAVHDAYAPSTITEFFMEHRFEIAMGFGVFLAILLALHALRVSQTKRKYLALSLTDPLTGLSSKEKCFKDIKSILQNAKPNEYMAVSVDIDKFSLLTQVYGVAKANEVLCYLAKHFENKYIERLNADCVTRLGNDVFLIFGKVDDINHELESQADRLTIMHDIKNILQSNYNISLSRGCYVIEDVTTPIETIIGYCNASRRAGKSEHGVSTIFFNNKMKEDLQSQKDIIYKMEHAIENNEFTLKFQPKIRLNNGSICGAEVLVRWQPPDSGTIYPNNFISVFEENAFITKLDLYVFEKTCEFIKKYRDQVRLPALAINFSGLTLLHVDTIENLINIMEEYGVTPNEIDIELTESALSTESNSFSNCIKKLCKLGFSIAIDDFGTGVSSLHRLSALCVHTVKLDKAFLDEKLTTKRGVFLVASIITMLRRLNIQVVAEGVEEQRQLDILKRLHCDVAQGLYFYDPIDGKTFIEVLSLEKAIEQKELHIATNTKRNQ